MKAVAEKVTQVRKLALAAGRTLRFGMRIHVIVRETTAKAWEAADDLIRYVKPEAVAQSQAQLARFDSVGQQGMVALHGGGQRSSLEISLNLWAGSALCEVVPEPLWSGIERLWRNTCGSMQRCESRRLSCPGILI